jgi:uncharacterized glyoxalase superfamily protein PhnB
MSEGSKTSWQCAASVVAMKLHPAVIELVVADMATTLAFYRLLGFDIPPEADQEPHVETTLAGSLRLAFDTEQTVSSLEPDWTAPKGGHRVALAFECDSPAEVDAAWQELIAAGCHGHLPPFDAVWGMRYAVIHDPDGTPVDLYARLAEA